MIKRYYNIFKNYYELIKDNKNKLIPYYIMFTLTTIVEIIIPIFVAKITENLTNSLYLATLVSILTLFGLKILISILSYLDGYFYSMHFFKTNYITMYKRVVNRIYNYNPRNLNTGKIINTLTEDIINIGEMADYMLIVALNIIKCIVLIIIFFNINIYLSIFIIFVDLIYIKVSKKLNDKALKYIQKQRKINDELIGLISQTMLALKDIRLLNMSNSLNEKYEKIYINWEQVYTKRRYYQIVRRSFIVIILSSALFVVYLISLYLIKNNNMTIGIMLLCISYFDSLFSSSQLIMEALDTINQQNVSIVRLNELLHEEKNNTKLTKYKIKEGIIEFKNVSFSYNDEPLLENLNFKIKPNKITAIIGSNGIGKTTILDLITKINEPLAGTILVDNKDISLLDTDKYLNEISILNQETFLFNFSIRENFDFVDKNTEKQKEICKFIGIDKFINELPNGYDTIIDKNSTNISGGEKRLLSLARTLLKESKILIFDEATSSLDIKGTEHICKILKKLRKNHTIIIVSHKNDVINIADEIIKIKTI